MNGKMGEKRGIKMFERLRTIRNIRQIEGDLYRVDYYANYKLEKLLTQGVKDVDDLLKFVSKELFFGYPIKVNENLLDDELSACTAFVATTPEGEKIVGRNFDYAQTGAMLVYTRPKNAYASYSMICLAHLAMCEENNTMPNRLIGKIMALTCPFACVDGLNEKGLSVSVLLLDAEPTAQDTGKTPITTTVAVRMLLDKCATTDEAVKELEKYDMYSSAGAPYHFLITDANGKTVVVAWPEQKMVVTNDIFVTNFQLAPGKDKGVGFGHDRYDIVKDSFEKTKGILSQADAMELLSHVKLPQATQWSIVYNKTDFSAIICKDMKYDQVHSIKPK